MTFLPDDEPRRVALQPPQFSLRSMFWAMTALSAFFAMITAVSMASAIALLTLIVLIAAHVVGNALGTRLRDGDRQAGAGARQSRASPLLLPVPPVVAAPSRLQQKRPIGWWTLGLILTGAMAGGTAGGLAIGALYWDRIHLPALSTGVLASAVIGAVFTFAASSFWSTLHHAWREATAETGQVERNSFRSTG